MNRGGVKRAVADYRERTTLPLLAQAGMLVVAGAAAVTSFDGLRGLAHRIGTPDQITFLLPVAIDAAAAVATLVWLTNAVPAVAAEARRLAWAAIILSVLGNAADHALGVTGVVPPVFVMLVVSALVGAIPPAIFGTVVHLAVAASREPARQLVTLTVRSPAVARPGATGPMDPPSLHAVPRAPGGKRNRDELEAAGRALDAFMDETGKDRIRRKTGESVDSLRARVEAAEVEDAARRQVRAYML